MSELTDDEIISYVATALAIIFLATNALILLNVSYASSGDWVFHKCYSSTLNASACSNGVYTNYPPQVTLGREVPRTYAPLTAYAGRWIDLRMLGLITLLVLCYALYANTKNHATLLVFLLIGGETLTTAAVKVGLLPFIIVLTIAAVTITAWKQLETTHKTALCVIALLTHALAGVFYIANVIVFQATGKKKIAGFNGLQWVTAISMATTVYTILVFNEYRPIYFVALYAAYLATETFKNNEDVSFNELAKSLAKREKENAFKSKLQNVATS